MDKVVIQGNVLVPGKVSGDVIGTTEMFSFWGGFNAQTGHIVDHHHPLLNVNISGKVLVMPRGKGSSTGSPILVDAIMSGNSPKAILLNEVDEIISLGAVVCQAFFGETIPVIVLNKTDFGLARKARTASITETGHIELEL